MEIQKRSSKDQAWQLRAAGDGDIVISQWHSNTDWELWNLARWELNIWQRSNHSGCGWRLYRTVSYYL
jgi:hypothetical protein